MAEGECLWKFHDLAKLEDLFLDQLPLTAKHSAEAKVTAPDKMEVPAMTLLALSISNGEVRACGKICQRG